MLPAPMQRVGRLVIWLSQRGMTSKNAISCLRLNAKNALPPRIWNTRWRQSGSSRRFCSFDKREAQFPRPLRCISDQIFTGGLASVRPLAPDHFDLDVRIFSAQAVADGVPVRQGGNPWLGTLQSLRTATHWRRASFQSMYGGPHFAAYRDTVVYLGPPRLSVVRRVHLRVP